MSNFYQDQNVVVLGGAGFVGRHLCKALFKRGAAVYVVDNLSRHGSQWSADTIDNLSIINIVTRGKSLSSILGRINPFAVFNLAAAVANVEYNQKHHNQMLLDNVNLQTIPVMISERLGVPHFLQVSSACVYGDDANAPAVEDNLGGEPVGANAGYSWAKRMGERAVYWSDLQHAVIVRPSNIYGPGDWYDHRAHVIPKLIKGHDQGTAKVFKNSSVREFIYVEDVARGMIHALEFGINKDVYNLGTENLTPVYHIHDFICKMMRKALPSGTEVPEFNQGDESRYSDCTKLAALGWTAETTFQDGLKKTIEAYLETR